MREATDWMLLIHPLDDEDEEEEAVAIIWLNSDEGRLNFTMLLMLWATLLQVNNNSREAQQRNDTLPSLTQRRFTNGSSIPQKRRSFKTQYRVDKPRTMRPKEAPFLCYSGFSQKR